VKSLLRLTVLVMFACCVFAASAQSVAAGVAENGPETPAYELTVSDRSGVVLASIPLAGGRFDLMYVHSFHLTPVVERYVVQENSGGEPVLHLFELEYESCGVGMPTEPEQGYRLVDGKFELSMDRTFAVIPLMISIVAGHGLGVDGKYLPFTTWLPPESMLILAARKATKR